MRPLTGRRAAATMAPMRILVVEDEPRMGELIRRVLVAEHHAVDLAPDGVSALAFASADEAYDVLVLDRMLPDLEGLELLRLLRSRGVKTPALMLTALGGVDERVAGLDAGADDYLAKPFAFSELLARVRALGRRPSVSAPDPLAAGDLELDQERHVARVGTTDGGPLGSRVRAPRLPDPPRGPGGHPPADSRRGVGSRA